MVGVSQKLDNKLKKNWLGKKILMAIYLEEINYILYKIK